MSSDKKTPSLRDKFGELPFTVFDAKTKSWQDKKKKWLALGIKSELGRDAICLAQGLNKFDPRESYTGKSVFDSTLCEIMYKWFCPASGKILDPFAGGSVRGIVAHKMGYKYTGIELSERQVDANIKQGKEICKDNEPRWIRGDSNNVLDRLDNEFDFIFSCPPYANLEVYSNDEADISNMCYEDFLLAYRSIISKSVKKLKEGCLAVFVVGDVRGDDGYYLDFISDTKRAFIDSGARLYNEAVLLESGLNTAAMRASKQFSSDLKLVKVHQNVLCFKKVGDTPTTHAKTTVRDFIINCDCGGKIKRVASGRMCQDCMKEF